MRCFVAIRPGEAVVQRLEHLSAHLHRQFPGARRLRSANLHVTLAFIGELPAPRAQALAQVVRSIPIEPFEWRLDRTGYFARAGVIWAGGDDPALSALALRVRGALQAQKVPFDPKPFVPHVSLLRDVPAPASGPGGSTDPAGPVEPIAWRVECAELLVSEPDPGRSVRYRPL